MEQETEPLQQKNEIKSEEKFNYKKCCGKFICIIFIIFIIAIFWLTICYGERNLPEEQQICKHFHM